MLLVSPEQWANWAKTVLSVRSIRISDAASLMSPYCTSPSPYMKAESRFMISMESSDENMTEFSRSTFTYFTLDCDGPQGGPRRQM